MLRLLTVTNLAVLEKASAEFGPGLNVITGETGAGKSVFMGALELALGARADASAVRDGAKEARIEAEADAAYSSPPDAAPGSGKTPLERMAAARPGPPTTGDDLTRLSGLCR